MRKILAMLIALLLFCTFTVSSFATAEETYAYELNGITVIFNAEDTWDAATREAVAHRLVYGDEGDASTYNLLCTLFGHKYETRTVTTITHCVLSEEPRCLEEHFEVTLCSRCDDSIVERLAYCYIYCCP
ncbi:MAG: hypothetical protein IJY16_09090 [Clostridia bacterium]|nr:hypothetical protein [Clostridia bacterium]